MNDYRVTYVLESHEQTIELVAETFKHVQAQLPAEAEILQIKFLRARGFSCHQRGAPAGR